MIGKEKSSVVMFLLGSSVALATTFYLSPKGDDSQPGTKDQPLATLVAARDAARKAGAGTHRIVVQPGDYYLEKTLTLDARDSGLTIEAAEPDSVVLYGGKPVTGWRRDGKNFWCADLPGVKEGEWDFRALVVNGRMPPRARFPKSGNFKHKSIFDVRWLSSVRGGWERKPTLDELTTMLYDPKDLPADLKVRNAELRVYHMWDESLVGVVSNDLARHALKFSTSAKSPPGAFNVKKYVIFNTREGMTAPGQWYLDRAAGRLVYWPLPGEHMTKVKVVAPIMERVVRLLGNSKVPVENITLRGFSIQATTTPLKPAGFGASAYHGALTIENARHCFIDNIEICNVGGQGINGWNLEECNIQRCRIHHIGACGIRAGGKKSKIAGNHIHHLGIYHPSAVAVNLHHTLTEANPDGFHFYRNEIHDSPYSGVTLGGGGHLIEENLISRVMLELQDGGAIYGSVQKCTLRGNVVRDVVKMGEGYGVSAYYFDEGSQDCVVERNVSIGVERPVHNHIASDLIIRDNVFISDSKMSLSFPRSRRCAFTGNTVFAPGKITVNPPTAISVWTNNLVIREGVAKGGVPQAFTINDAMPAAKAPGRRSYPFGVVQVAQPPVLNGLMGSDEWPGSITGISREPSRWGVSGAPAFAKFAYDDQNLYVAVKVVLFDINKLSRGAQWGRDDGAEICIAGAKGTFVVRGLADGMLKSVTDAGVSSEAADALGKASRFTAKFYGRTKGDWKSGWCGEWSIPFSALGIKPVKDAKVAFNLGVYRAEDGVWRCLEGTLAENWKLDQAAVIQFK
jgi:hypothetical protein